METNTPRFYLGSVTLLSNLSACNIIYQGIPLNQYIQNTVDLSAVEAVIGSNARFSNVMVENNISYQGMTLSEYIATQQADLSAVPLIIGQQAMFSNIIVSGVLTSVNVQEVNVIASNMTVCNLDVGNLSLANYVGSNIATSNLVVNDDMTFRGVSLSNYIVAVTPPMNLTNQGLFKGEQGTFSNILASNIATSNLVATFDVRTSNLFGNVIGCERLRVFEGVQAAYIWSASNESELVNAKVLVTHTLLGSNASFSNAIVTNTLTGSNAAFSNLIASSIVGSNSAFSNLIASSILGSNAAFSNAIIAKTLTGSNAAFSNLTVSQTISQNELVASNIRASNLTVSNLMTSNIFAGVLDSSNLPTYSWVGDMSTGMYHQSNNTIGFTVGGTHIMTLNNTSNIYGTRVGRVGIGTSNPYCPLHVAMSTSNNSEDVSIYAERDIAAFSDARYKTNIEVIQNALSNLDNINGYTYNWITGGKRCAGVLAQEVQQVLPEVVTTDPEGKLSVAYGNMLSFVLQALKELKDEVGTIKHRLDSL